MWFVKHKIPAVFIAAALAGGGYFAYQKFHATGTTAPQYVTAKVARGTLVVSVTGSGQISSSNQTGIQAQAAGTVVAIPAQNNQKVNAGDLLVKLDPKNEERAVRNAKTGLDSAKLALQTLEEPATTSTVLQAEKSVSDSQISLATSQNNLTTDYNNTYTDISNTFIDLATVMTGLNNVLYGTTINKSQYDVDAYTNMISNYYPGVTQYNQAAAANYQAALAAYNQNLSDFKNATIYSSTSMLDTLLGETYATLKSISAANASAKNLLDLVQNTQNTLQQNSQKIVPQLATDETNMQSYITLTNNHLATILQRINSLQADKQAISSANLSISQSQAALDQLKAGATDLDVRAKQLAVTQAQNALTDAEQNLENDYVRAPFAGIVTNINAKIGQPTSGVLATLLSDVQIAQATFNEVDIVNVKVGQKATITFDALPNLTLTGKVTQVDTLGTISQGVVNYNVQVALDVPSSSVKPGMSDTVSIITSVKPDVLLVPDSAVATRQGASFVQVIGADGAVKQAQVTIGASSDTKTEIVSGLNEGDVIVTQTIKTGAAATPTTQNSGFRIPGLGGLGGRGGGGRPD